MMIYDFPADLYYICVNILFPESQLYYYVYTYYYAFIYFQFASAPAPPAAAAGAPDGDESSDDDDFTAPAAAAASRTVTPVPAEAEDDAPDLPTPPANAPAAVTPVGRRKKDKRSALEDTVREMAAKIKTCDALELQIARMMEQITRESRDPVDTWITWLGAEARRIHPDHWRAFQAASLTFMSEWTMSGAQQLPRHHQQPQAGTSNQPDTPQFQFQQNDSFTTSFMRELDAPLPFPSTADVLRDARVAVHPPVDPAPMVVMAETRPQTVPLPHAQGGEVRQDTTAPIILDDAPATEQEIAEANAVAARIATTIQSVSKSNTGEIVFKQLQDPKQEPQ